MVQVPTKWKQTLDKNYPVFRDQLKPDEVIEHMHVSEEERRNFNGMSDHNQRTDFLMKQLLPNGTKTLVKEFQNGLKLTGQEQLLPYTPGKRGLKRSKSVDSGQPTADDLPFMIHVNGHKFVKLMQHHDKPIVNLREYITDTEGKLHPTKKGILLSMEDWKKLVKVDITPLMNQKKEYL